ncbi:MAG: MFS transporter [Kiritimatiellae bacterium]|nr:MFS transporter [Kiritimatiellia bacterium]
MTRLFDDESTNRRFGRLQWRMLFATMIGYTLFYFMRKNFSFAMPGLEQDCGISKPMLGNFLFCGGIVYGLSKFLNGIIGDKVRPRKMFLAGLFACVLVNVAYGFAPQLSGGNASALVWIFGILLVLNQFFQGTGFPPCAKLIAYWVPPEELATKMSVWNTSHSIGGGLVAKICGVVMGLGVIGAANQGVGMWRWCFWTMAILGALGLLLMLFWLPGTPKEEGLPDLPGTECKKNSETINVSTVENGKPAHLSVARMVYLNPVIWLLGAANFTINGVRALVADWGPTMLQEAKGLTSSEAGTVIMIFEFAGIAGMLFAGWATDRLFAGRAPRLCLFMMLATALCLGAFWFLPAGLAGSAALCIAGFCLYGPQALTGVTATNTSTKSFAGTSIGFISLFSYIGVSVAGKVFGNLAGETGSWAMPLTVTIATALAGTGIFLCLWRTKANAYD